MTILTPMDQLKEQERIHKNNLLDLNEYPLRSDKRGKYLRAFYSYKTKYIKNYKKELYHTWRVKTCKCVCGLITTNQNLQKHKQSKKHFENLENKEPTNNFETVVCECGGTYSKSNKSHHCKTKKHLLKVYE